MKASTSAVLVEVEDPGWVVFGGGAATPGLRALQDWGRDPQNNPGVRDEPLRVWWCSLLEGGKLRKEAFVGAEQSGRSLWLCFGSVTLVCLGLLRLHKILEWGGQGWE